VSSSVKISGSSLALVAPLDLTEACLATPAFRAIKNARPDLSPVILCPKSAVPFWSIHFAQILPYDETASAQQLAERFSSGTFHSAIILEDSRAARALSRLGIPQRLGRECAELKNLLSEPISIATAVGPPRHKVTLYLDLIDKIGCSTNNPANFSPPARLPRPQVPRIALAPDSDFGPSAQWPIESFHQFTELLAKTHEVEFFLVSLPGKSPATDALSQLLQKQKPSKGKKSQTGGDINLGNLLEMLPTFTALVGGNSTLIHLAAHLGLPTVALMGPHSPITHRPLGRIHEVLTTHAECSPCNLKKCPLDHRCLNELTPEAVTQATIRLLDGKPLQ